MHYADIIANLKKSGYNLKRVASELDMDESAISHVIHQRTTSRNIANHIAKIIGKPVHALWPGKYKERSAA